MAIDAPESGDHDQEGADDRTPTTCRFPAAYSGPVLESIRRLTPTSAQRILDPFAGPTGIRLLRVALGSFAYSSQPRRYLGVEIEPEWAQQGENTIVGDVSNLASMPEVKAFEPDMVITSPPYGNRLADQYLGDPKGSERHTYAIALGRKLDPASSARLQWGPKYKLAMAYQIEAICQVLPIGGHLIWNIANHYRKKKLQLVVPWTVEEILAHGLQLQAWDVVKVRKLRHGENHEARDDHEQLFLFRKTA